MRQETSLLNKALAFMLCMFVILSSINLSMITYAADSVTDYSTVTDADLVADNYGSLSSGEKAILKSGLLEARTFTYPVPSSGDNLVAVDADARKITVSEYSKDGYVWRPASAAVVYTGGSETVELTDGEGTFTYDGNSYTVEVLFELYIAVDQTAQAKLLNGPYYLIKGINNLNDFDGFYATFDTVGTNISGLKSLADGIRLSSGAVIKISNQDTIDAVNDLYAQSSKNGGPIDITLLIENYEDAASKTVYLLENGAAFKETGIGTYLDIKAITEDKGLPTLMEAIKSREPATYRKINLALNAMKALVTGTQSAAEDEWGILNPANNALKSGLTDEDYEKLDRLIEEAGEAEYHEDEIKDKLFVNAKTISANVNQHDVTVIVSAEIIKETSFDNATPTSLEDHTAVFQLSDGTSAADILAAIAECGVEEAALTAWGEISEENYVRTADEITGTLVADLTYKIKYSPKMLEIEYDFDTDLPETVPYGYNMTLPTHEGEELVYDYTVNGKAYLQGEIVRITEDSQINRTEGKPWNVQTINKLVALNFTADLNAAQIAVLNSVALRSDYIRLREPDNNDGLVGVMVLPDSGEGTNNTEQTFKYMVMAQNYASGLRGLSWKAVSGKAILGTDEITAEFVFNDGVAAFTSVQFDRVEVEYRIVLEGVVTEQQIIDAYNLPHVLALEAAEQKRNLELLNNQYSNLGQFTKATLNQIKFGVSGSDMSEESKAAVEAIINGCVDSEAGQLYLYTYLTEYRKSGLTYYYQDNNYLRIRNQIQILKDNLSTVYNDPEFLPLLIDIEYEEYYEDIADIIDKLSEITLSDPHEAINTASPSLAELVAAIEQVGDVQDIAATDVQLVLTKTLDAAAPQRAVVSITVQAVNSIGDVIKSGTNTRAFSIVEPLTDADIAGLNEMIEALVRSLAIDTAHYETADVLGLEAGTTLQSNAVITITYSPKEYTVQFVDENGNEVGTTTFKYDLPTIILPACEEAGMQYRYTVCGTEIIVGSEAKSVTFTAEQIDSGEYAVIVRATADVYRENVLDLVAELNKGAVNASMVDNQSITMAFIPMEDANGNLVLVFRISPDNLDHISDYLQKVAEAITATDYSYIKIGNDFLREESLISLQAMINTVLYSGMSLDTLLGVIDPDGHINEMTLPGVTPIGADADGRISVSGGKYIANVDLLGGKLIETTMNFGVSRNDTGISAKLYITLEDFGKSTSDLKDARDMIQKVRNHGNITAHDGKLDIEVELPDRAYQAYLTAMIALGNTNFANLEEIDILPAKDLILDIVTYLVSDETITTATYENTADKVDYDLDLSDYNSLYNSVRKILNTMLKNLTFANEQATSNSYASDLNFDLTEILDDLDLADTFRGMIKEADSGIEFGLKLTITNSTDYEALVLDPGASGLGVVNYTRDLASVLPRIHKNTVVILLSDINGDIVAKQNMYLDLNGHMVYGSLKGEADLTVFDSVIATRSGAGATGSITGNVTLIAGKYSTDVSAFIRKGFIVEDDGTVRNGYYYVEVEGDTINVHLTPEVDVLKSTDQTGYELLAADFGADVLLNYYMCSALRIGGNNIYDMHVNDLVRLYQRVEDQDANDILDCIDCAGITAFANDLLDKLTDFTALSEAMKAGEAVFSYDMEYQPWSFELEHVTNGDYLTVNVLPNANVTKSQTMNFFIDEDGDIAGMLEALGKVLTVDAEVELSDISYDFQHDNITITGGARVDVVVDMTSDPDYAIVVAVALANGTEDDAKREALIEGIKKWYESGYIMSELKEAVENMTTAELVKAFDTSKAFTAMVADLGLTGIVGDSAADLYKTYESAIKAGFVLIDRLGNIRGGNTLIGSLESEYGVYVKNAGSRVIDRTEKIRDNYGVQITATIESVSLTVKLFTEDADSPIIVLDENGDQVWKGDDLNEAFEKALDGYTVVVRADVELGEDVELDREVKLEGVEFIDFLDSKIVLMDENAKLTADKQITDYVESGDEAYYVNEEQNGEEYVYTLAHYLIIVMNGDEILYKGDDLGMAFTAATAGATITVYGNVVLAEDVELDRAVTLAGADYVDFGEYAIILTSEDAELTVDKQITGFVESDDDTYFVNEEKDDDKFVYTLERYPIIVTNGDELLYAGDDLNAAFEAATAGSTVIVYDEVVLANDVELDRDVTIVGVEYVDFNGKKIILTSEEAKLTSDEKITDSVESADPTYYVIEAEVQNNYEYTLSRYKVVVTNGDEILYKGDDINAAFEAATAGSTVTVYGEVELTADIELDREVALAGADLVTFGDYGFILTSTDAKLTSDKQITDYVDSFDPIYYVVEEGSYEYTLEIYNIVVTNGDEILYRGDDLNEAFEAATAGSTITVYGNATLTADVELDRPVTVEGADLIDFNGKSIILTSEDAELTIDKQVTENVESGSEYSEVTETATATGYVYTIKALDPTISNPAIEKGDIIAAYKIDNTKKIIILDILDPKSIDDFKLSGNGITAKQLAQLVSFTYVNASASQMNIVVKNTKLSDSTLVPTGAEIIVTASNPDSNVTAQTTYTIVILGDTNCNGRIDSGDAKLMLDHYFGTTTLGEFALIAADVNCNGRIESGDAVKNSVKYNRPADYKSDLK